MPKKKRSSSKKKTSSKRSDDTNSEQSSSQKSSTKLLELANEHAEFWHTSSGEAYASCWNGEAHENCRVRDRKFLRWLAGLKYTKFKSAASQQELTEAIQTLEAQALYSGNEIEAYVRVAESNGDIFIDIGDDTWDAICVTKKGYEICSNPPVKFRRSRGTRSLPRPVSGGKVSELQDFLNVSSTDWPLVVGWLVAAFRPSGPYCLLELLGEQGTAKTTTARVLRSLVDPCASPVLATPRSVQDLMITATHNWLLCFDNLSYLKVNMSDALCRISTGGGLSTREYYTNDEEVILDAQRPVIITGIEDVCLRSDLLDRSIPIELTAIQDADRISEREFWQNYEASRARILGALLESIAVALKEFPSITLTDAPRMADFARWVSAAEPSLEFSSGTILKAYKHNLSKANEIAIDNSALASSIVTLMQKLEKKKKNIWEGTATQLLMDLLPLIDAPSRNHQSWPKNARALSGHLKRLGPNLRGVGIQIERSTRGSGNKKRKVIVITKA